MSAEVPQSNQYREAIDELVSRLDALFVDTEVGVPINAMVIVFYGLCEAIGSRDLTLDVYDHLETLRGDLLKLAEKQPEDTSQ